MMIKHGIHEAVVLLLNAFYKVFVRSFLFLVSWSDAERAHLIAMPLLRLVGAIPFLKELVSFIGVVRDSRLEQSICGHTFRTPVGIAAGFDKYAVAMHGLEALGFCPVEEGSFTHNEEPGNPRPRMFRLWPDRALINRMKFNNPGADRATLRFQRSDPLSVPLFINVGKSVDTPLEEAPADYCYTVERLYPHASALVINPSSPNSPQLRKLQGRALLDTLLSAVMATVDRLARQYGVRKPIYVKIAPDLTWEEIDDIIAVCLKYGITGIIATNTTVSREGLVTKIDEMGGLSGPPLYQRALEVVGYIAARVPKDFVIIGVGGIRCARDAYDMLKAGAWIVQVLTAFPYEGPFIATAINLGLLRLMERDGFTHISQIRKRM